MRKIKEVIRLKFEADLSDERIATATGVSKGAVTKYLQRAREAGRRFSGARFGAKTGWSATTRVPRRPA